MVLDARPTGNAIGDTELRGLWSHLLKLDPETNAVWSRITSGRSVSVQDLPRDAKFLAKIADLGFRLPHCRHCQP